MENKMIEVGDLVRIKPELIGGDQIICLVTNINDKEELNTSEFLSLLTIESISDRQIYYVGESQVEVLNGDSIENCNPE